MNLRTVVYGLMITASALGADVGGNWVLNVPRPDGTSRDAYFRLQQDVDKLSGVIQTGFNNRPIDSGFVTGNHARFISSAAVTYEGDLVGDELRLEFGGAGARRPGGDSDEEDRGQRGVAAGADRTAANDLRTMSDETRAIRLPPSGSQPSPPRKVR